MTLSKKMLKSNFDLKRTAGIFNNLLILISKAFFRDFRGPLFAIIIPILFTLLFFFVMGNKFAGHMSLYGYMFLPSLSILMLLPPSLVEWKNSVFLKRIDTTGIKKGLFLLSLWLFFILLGLLSISLVFVTSIVLSLLIEPNNEVVQYGTLIDSFKKINWGLLILSLIFVLLTVIGISTLIGGIFNSESLAQGITMIFYFFSLFLSGMFLPPALFEKSNFMIWMTYFVILKYSVFIFLYATQGTINNEGWDAFFNKHQIDDVIVKDFTALWQPILGASLIIVTLFVLTFLTFKWSAKK